jgi:aldose 1-epimerase
MQRLPSGEQWTLTAGDQQAVVVEVGGGLRTYTVDGLDILAGYRRDEQARAGRGQLLVPWPNRVRDGRYTFRGRTHQLPLSEPPLANANHGLVRWALWSVEERSAASLTVGYRLHPQPGWPGHLDLAVTYDLQYTGLLVSSRAVNTGSEAVPFGYGAHPYLALGETSLGDVVLTVPAAERVLVDDRMLPVGTEPVAGTEFDLRGGRPLGATRLDTAYTALERDARGRWRVRLGGLAGRPDVSLWADGAFGWVQVFTRHGEDAGVQGVRGIAVEPMSCPADAFNSGQGLVVLEPGDSWSGQWGVSVHR